MYYKISPGGSLLGDVRIPGSKSGTARGLIIGTMAEGVSRIQNPMPGIDSYSIADCCRALGAKIDTDNEKEWIVEGVGLENLKCRPVSWMWEIPGLDIISSQPWRR